MNIKFSKITIHHFLSYDHAEVELNDKGFCLVKGVNRNPKDSAKSNGSGKSTIFNAISYALTGETLQGLKSNLANIAFNDGCWVKLEFSVDGHDYVLLRSKEDEKLGTDLKISIDGKDCSGKGIRESEKALAELLPDLTSELVGSVILIGQNMPMKFTANTPVGRKEVLEHLTQSDFMIQDLKERIAQRADKLNDYIREQEDSILSDNSKLTVLNEQLEKAKTDLLEHYTDMKNYPAILEKLKAEEAELHAHLTSVDEQVKLAADSVAEVQPELIAKINERQAALLEVMNEYKSKFAAINEKRTGLRATILTLENEITAMKNIKDVCPTCGRPFEGVVKPDTSVKETQLAEVKQVLESVRKEEEGIEADNVKANAEVNDKYEVIVRNLNEAVTKRTAAHKELQQEYFNTNSQYLSKQNEIASVTREQEMFEENRTKLMKSISEYEAQIATLLESMNAARDKKAVFEEHLAVVNKMNTVIKRDFRGFLLKNIIDYIDAKSKEYASKIFGCNEVAFTLDGNNIGISFCNKDYENLSGGEKQRLDLIIQFAIRDFISQYLNFSCNLLVLDEITDALDNESCDKVISFIIDELSSVESVFIISHHADELALPCDSEVIVEKTADGISRVVTA